ncbi:hypothetical protein BBL07_23770 [Agrobacterium vitis]|nr:hypothetical protein BBL07_23770 [Agrobacterium vitis]
MDKGGQREIQGAQAEDGEDVRGVDDIGIRGDRKNRRDRVNRKHQVNEFHHDQREKQRRDVGFQLASCFVLLTHHEPVAFQLVGDRQVAPRQLQSRVVGDIIFAIG